MRNFPIFDGHNDVLMSFAPPYSQPIGTFFQRNTDRHFDLPRAKDGHFGGGIFAVFIEDASSMALLQNLNNLSQGGKIEATALDFAAAQQATMHMVANFHRIAKLSNGQMKVVRTANELDECLRTGVVAAVLHFEGAEPIGPDLDELEVYYQAGLRSLGIVWSRPTLFGEGVPFMVNHSPDTGPGLTDLGKALVRACNHMGILIDLSHLNEKGFWDVARISRAPLVATHSNAYALVPITRNLTNAQLDAIKESGGLVGVNLVTAFLNADASARTDVAIETIVRHFDYLINRMGIEHVGFGSDFGPIDIPVPDVIQDITGLPRVINALRQAGYGDSDLRRIAYENWARVLRKTWSV